MTETATFEDTLYVALLEFLKRNDVDAVKVTDFEDRTEYGGFCETCSYTYVVCDIDYLDSNGRSRLYTYDGSFAGLISEL